MSTLIKVFKTLSFLVLLIIVTWQYAVEIYGKFINDSKTFVSKTVRAENFILPPITICMDNALKPSVLEKVVRHFNSRPFNPKGGTYNPRLWNPSFLKDMDGPLMHYPCRL